MGSAFRRSAGKAGRATPRVCPGACNLCSCSWSLWDMACGTQCSGLARAHAPRASANVVARGHQPVALEVRRGRSCGNACVTRGVTVTSAASARLGGPPGTDMSFLGADPIPPRKEIRQSISANPRARAFGMFVCGPHAGARGVEEPQVSSALGLHTSSGTRAAGCGSNVRLKMWK